MLQSLDIQSLKNSYPKDLSGGERQRVAIARALYNEPSLILADEPTASLDTDHAYEVVKLLVKEAHEKQKATIMVTHDVRMIQWSDRVYRMEDGYLTEEEKRRNESFMTMKGYPHIIRDKGEMWMPKETFFNLSNAKKQRIDDLLLEIFCSQHISQVKVSEIVDKMGMSRGAFINIFKIWKMLICIRSKAVLT